jgi:hypothetical protein
VVSFLIDQQSHQRVISVGRREMAVDLLDHAQRAMAEDLGQLDRVHASRQCPGREEWRKRGG